jgi:hypothetical protein
MSDDLKFFSPTSSSLAAGAAGVVLAAPIGGRLIGP